MYDSIERKKNQYYKRERIYIAVCGALPLKITNSRIPFLQGFISEKRKIGNGLLIKAIVRRGQ